MSHSWGASMRAKLTTSSRIVKLTKIKMNSLEAQMMRKYSKIVLMQRPHMISILINKRFLESQNTFKESSMWMLMAMKLRILRTILSC